MYTQLVNFDVAWPEAQREANSALQLGLSAIIGSGMIAFLLAPAICALGARQVLKLKRRPLAKNILFYVLSLFALCWFFMDGGALEPTAESLTQMQLTLTSVDAQ